MIFWIIFNTFLLPQYESGKLFFNNSLREYFDRKNSRLNVTAVRTFGMAF